MASRARKLTVAGASGVGWPLSIVLLGAAITFRVVPVFAESAPTYDCERDAPTCVGKADGSPCTGCGAPTCFCSPGTCRPVYDAGPFDDAGNYVGPTDDAGRFVFQVETVCKPILGCDEPSVGCGGKKEGEICGQDHTCLPGKCVDLEGDHYVARSILNCSYDPTGGANAPPAPRASTPPPSAPPAVTSADTDSGCNASATDVGVTSLAVPGLLAAWLLARRRRFRRG